MKSLFTTALIFAVTLSLFAQTPAIKRIAQPVSSSAACCGFRVYNSSEIPMTAGNGKESIIVFDKEIFDDANSFNGPIYKTPVNGTYQFNVQMGLKAKNNGNTISQVMLEIKTSSQKTTQLINIPAGYDNVITAESTALFKLKTGEEVSVALINMGNATAVTTGNISYFSGVKLY